MSDEIMLVFGEDGVARKYDDTWDITIHCESEEEQKAVLEKLNNSNQEPQELSKNSPKLDKKNGDLQPTCNQLAKNTNVPCKDTISRQAAIDALVKAIRTDPYYDSNEPINGLGVCDVRVILNDLPSAQPEPCEDAVSREAAIDVAENAFVRGLLASPDIRRLPSAQPEPHWIPVSERLPESKHEDLEYPTVIVCCGDGAVTLACYYESTKEWGTGEYYDRIINPVAWMPLPEPYRAERRTDETD